MRYRYSGYERLTLWFDNPNQCGAALGMVACMLLAFLLCVDGERLDRLRVLSSVLILAVVYTLCVATYSRGAIVGVLSTLLLLVGLRASSWRRAAGLGVLLVVIMLAMPGSPERLASLGAPASDASISNRILIWKTALAMAWDLFPGGVGAAGFREHFAAWYQAADRFQVYTTAVSDYATITAYWGLPALAAYLGAIIFALAACLGAFLRSQAPWLLACFAGGLCYAVASCFTTMLFSSVFPFFLCLLVGGLVLAAWEADRAAVFLLATIWGIAATVVAAMGGTGLAAWSATRFATAPVGGDFSGIEPGANLEVLRPRASPGRAVVLLLLDRWFPEYDARRLARPLAESGYVVAAYSPGDFLGAGLKESRSVLAQVENLYPDCDVFILGVGDAGRLAALLAAGSADARLKGVVMLGASYWHPNPSFSPMANAGRLKLPTLLIRYEQDELRNPAEAARFQVTLADVGTPATLVRLTGKGVHTVPELWSSVRGPLLKFFDSPRKL